jgi:hypothetical protein
MQSAPSRFGALLAAANTYFHLNDMQGNRAMERKIIVTASIIVLIASLGAADAGTAARPHPSPVPASGQAARRLNSFDSAVATLTAERNARRYHGGPKSND